MAKQGKKRGSSKKKGIPGYAKEPMRKKTKLVTEEYEYELPFNYRNVTVHRERYKGSEFHGMELNPVNTVSGLDPELSRPCDAIVVKEPYPIVRVVVIGSACTPPGYVQIECEPVKGWRRPDEIASVMPVRLRINGLWGMHLRWDQWYAAQEQVQGVVSEEPYEQIPKALDDVYPGIAKGCLKGHYREWPLAGMSSAIFEVPPSKKVIVTGGCETPGWLSDNAREDFHYSFRIIRTTVHLPEKT